MCLNVTLIARDLIFAWCNFNFNTAWNYIYGSYTFLFFTSVIKIASLFVRDSFYAFLLKASNFVIIYFLDHVIGQTVYDINYSFNKYTIVRFY